MEYIIVQFGEVLEGIFNYEEMMSEVRIMARQYIYDFMRHNLPKKLTHDDIRSFDIEVYEIGNSIILPFQAWADEYYDDMKEQQKRDEEQEYKRFLELYEKYKDCLPE